MADEKTPRDDLPNRETIMEDQAASTHLPPIPEMIGSYRVKGVIGTGAMGVVYLARQESPSRDVAIKVMKAGVVSRKALRRFEFEAQTLGRLQHPAIAQIYEAGTWDDGEGARPFFAMEYVSNAKELGAYVRNKHLDIRARLELFRAICEGVEYGHRRSVIHRDLKPGNILVNADGHPKVIDFGVARSTDSDAVSATLATEAGQLIGTLQYMSPEQVELDPAELDTRSDVYALGVILYQLLVDKLPYDLTGTSLAKAAELIKETQPTRLRDINANFKGDLETICLKALEKDRGQRYQSVGELAEDIRRYLKDEPITARPPTRAEQLRRFARKNKAASIATAVIVLAMIAATVISIVFGLEASRQRAIAEGKTRDLQQVADFQAKQLSGINVPAMGQSLRTAMLGELELQPSAAAGADFIGVALQLLNEHVFDRTLDAISQEFADQHLIQAQLLQTMATSLHTLGLLEEATDPQTRALDLRIANLGRAHADTLSSIHSMGALLKDHGKYDEAELHWKEALETRRRILGDEHPDTLVSINAMGSLRSRQGRYDEMVPYFVECLEARRRILGDEHPDTLDSIGNMGYLISLQGKHQEAEPYFREALETRRRVLGNEHPDTLDSLSNMGSLLERQRKYAKAMTYFAECLETRRRTLGDEHPDTLLAMGNMAKLLERQRKYDEAMLYATECLETRRRTLGDEHPRTLWSIANMGYLLEKQRKLDEAVACYVECLEASRRTLGDDHPSTQSMVEAMGSLLSKQHKYAEAMPFMLEDLNGLQHALGDSHPLSMKSLKAMIKFLKAWHAADPDSGHDAMAAQYREQLEQLTKK